MGFLKNIFGRKHTDPVTGEQHRTGLRKTFHGLHNVERAVRPIAKPLLPAAIGTALPFLLPAVGRSFGVDPSGFMGKALMMNEGNSASPMSQLLNVGKGQTLRSHPHHSQNRSQNSSHSPEEEQEKVVFELLGKGFTWKDLLDLGLLTTTIIGKLGARERTPHQASISDALFHNRAQWSQEHQPRPYKKLNRRYIKPPANYRPGIDPEWNFFEEEIAPQPYRKGGYIKKSHSGGQDDDINMTLPEGAYVWNATDVSLLGDGHSENGAQKLKQFEDSFLRSGIIKYHGPSRGIKAKVSNGEYLMSPEVVSIIGKGDNKKGAQIIDEARKRLRRQKGVKKILPPKAKPIDHYLRVR